MNSRPPPPQGAPPSYTFVSRVYRRNLRPIVISTAFLTGIWSLFAGIAYFRSSSIDRSQNVPHIANLSIALGASYIAVCVIGVFGMYSAMSQRVGAVRIYTLLASLATLIVIGAGLTRVVTHFVWKNDILSECTTLTSNNRVVDYGFWGSFKAGSLDPADAAAWCRKYWDRGSWVDIITFLVLTVLGVLFASLAFAYYRQLLDPTSAANASRAPSNQIRTGDFPTHYNPPYNAAVPNLSYSYGAGPYAPPPGPPPGHDDAFVPPYDSKPPGYTGGDMKGFDADDKDSKNPFSDFDGPTERDVTSRPHPSGPESFR